MWLTGPPFAAQTRLGSAGKVAAEDTDLVGRRLVPAGLASSLIFHSMTPPPAHRKQRASHGRLWQTRFFPLPLRSVVWVPGELIDP